MSHGSAFHLVRHMLDVEWSWRLFAIGAAGERYLWEVEDVGELPAIRRFWRGERVSMLEYLKGLSYDDLEKDIDYGTAQGGKARFMKVWQILLHIQNHGVHPRSELAGYLENCGLRLNQELNLATYLGLRSQSSK